MPDREAIERGLAFEAEVAEALGISATKASGNQWSDRGDGRGRGLRPSCKANPTTRRGWGKTRAELRESIEIAHGSGQLPLLAIQDQDGAKLVLMRLEDFAEVLNGDRSPAPMKRSERVRAIADIPLLRRAET
jgi:hypothetical protein